MEENFSFDREIGFDIPQSFLKPSTGETFLAQIERVYDEKGNSGVVGKVLFSNLRMVWYSRSDPKMNLSIGYDTIILNK
jgi:Bardet-Biedl syndrome 5 protein